MLPFTVNTLRIFTHILAATIWVGGQLTLAGLVPTLRAVHADAPRAAARRFNRIAWSAYAVLIATGIWILIEVQVADRTTEYQVTVLIKLGMVAASGITAFLHARATTRAGLALGGAAGAISALGALMLGVMLRG